MSRQNTRAAGRQTRTALKTHYYSSNSNTVAASLTGSGNSNPEAGKRAAIAAYSHGWLSLEACAQLFALNPRWKSA